MNTIVPYIWNHWQNFYFVLFSNDRKHLLTSKGANRCISCSLLIFYYGDSKNDIKLILVHDSYISLHVS